MLLVYFSKFSKLFPSTLFLRKLTKIVNVQISLVSFGQQIYHPLKSDFIEKWCLRVFIYDFSSCLSFDQVSSPSSCLDRVKIVIIQRVKCGLFVCSSLLVFTRSRSQYAHIKYIQNNDKVFILPVIERLLNWTYSSHNYN